MASKTGYHHLTFDDAVRGPAEKASDREKLRNKLVDVGQRFIGFDKAVEEDTIKRRTNEVKRLKEAHEGVNKLEKALNCEIKRRVDANKQVQGLTEHLANDMLDKLQSNIMERVEKLAISIESLTLRCTALEKAISQFKGELPSKLQVDTASLVKEISSLRKQAELDRQSRIERDTALLRRLAEMDSHEAAMLEKSFNDQMRLFQRTKAEIDGLARQAELEKAESDSRTDKFRSFILEEIAGMKNTLQVTAQARAQTDDEIVQAMTQYSHALQKGLQAATIADIVVAM
eukprot:CAMPEP_0169099894 /NCGR_PEP_ID=MMETSP1015-20121227/20797_1 /TAXON_ID=342587 /ORGANISM="Karlodinium micrum, Strain CCMP2283" /LENGTH=287 /DNA_ID=CAMNT_0009160799 /DNA_START=80 /DNA_END=944 /DNA_ORIENTATION=+